MASRRKQFMNWIVDKLKDTDDYEVAERMLKGAIDERTWEILQDIRDELDELEHNTTASQSPRDYERLIGVLNFVHRIEQRWTPDGDTE